MSEDVAGVAIDFPLGDLRPDPVRDRGRTCATLAAGDPLREPGPVVLLDTVELAGQPGDVVDRALMPLLQFGQPQLKFEQLRPQVAPLRHRPARPRSSADASPGLPLLRRLGLLGAGALGELLRLRLRDGRVLERRRRVERRRLGRLSRVGRRVETGPASLVSLRVGRHRQQQRRDVALSSTRSRPRGSAPSRQRAVRDPTPHRPPWHPEQIMDVPPAELTSRREITRSRR